MAPFFAYCKARSERDARSYALNVYVAETVRAISCGKSLQKSWDEFWGELTNTSTAQKNADTYESVLSHLKQKGLEVE